MGLLDGKVAVITGAGAGMGKAAAQVFAREGAKLVICDISGAEQQTAAEIGGDIVVLSCNVADEAQVAKLIETAVSRFGRLDAMLNVAGIADGGMMDTLDEAHFDRIIGVNLKGVFFGCKHAIRAMKNNGGGTIVNWASLAGLIPSPGGSIYSASKAGVVQLTKSIAVEFGAANIRANALCPGMIVTAMGSRSLQNDPSKAVRNPMGRPGSPEDAAELAAFLASDRANYLNGVIIPLDGGWSAKLA